MQRLLAAALEHWYVLDGYAAGHGAPDPMDLPLHRLCNYIRWIFTKDMDDQQRARFEADLYRPPPGEEPQGPWAPEAETAALAELSRSFGAQ